MHLPRAGIRRRLYGCLLALLLPFRAAPIAQAPARPLANGFYVESESGWLPLTAYAEYHAATETLTLVNGWTDDIPDVAHVGRFAIEMPNWKIAAVLVAGDDLLMVMNAQNNRDGSKSRVTLRAQRRVAEERHTQNSPDP